MQQGSHLHASHGRECSVLQIPVRRVAGDPGGPACGLLLLHVTRSRRPLVVHSPGPHVLILIGAPLSEVLCPSSAELPASPRASPKHPQPNKPLWVLQPSLRSTSSLLPTPPQEGRAGPLLPCGPRQEGCTVAAGAGGTSALGWGAQALSQQGQGFFGAQGCRVSPWKVQRLGPCPLGFPGTSAGTRARRSGPVSTPPSPSAPLPPGCRGAHSTPGLA